MKFLIDFQSTASTDEISQYLIDIGASILKEYSFFNKVFLVDVSQQPSPNSFVQAIAHDSELSITLAETIVNQQALNYTKTASVDPNNSDDWWKTFSIEGQDLNSGSLTIPKRGKNIDVYLLDSGVMDTHPEFASSNISQLFSFNNDFTDIVGHGTAMASLINGQTCSLTDATVKSVKIYHDGTGFHHSDFLNALEAVAADMSLSPKKSYVVNMSWTMPKNAYVESKISLLMSSFNCVGVVSAGNTGQSGQDLTPTSIDSCIVVGSYDEDFNPCDFSSVSTNPWVLSTQAINTQVISAWAPGINIRVARLDNTVGLASGTSVSSAIHAAALAYNLSYISNNEIYKDYEISIYKSFTVSKPKILQLSDTSYYDSRNYVTSYRTGSHMTTRYEYFTNVTTSCYATVNTKERNYANVPWIIDSVSYETLPEGVSIGNDGIVFFDFPDTVLGNLETKSFTFNLNFTSRGLSQPKEITVTVRSTRQALIEGDAIAISCTAYDMVICPSEGCGPGGNAGICTCDGYRDPKTSDCIENCCHCSNQLANC